MFVYHVEQSFLNYPKYLKKSSVYFHWSEEFRGCPGESCETRGFTFLHPQSRPEGKPAPSSIPSGFPVYLCHWLMYCIQAVCA